MEETTGPGFRARRDNSETAGFLLCEYLDGQIFGTDECLGDGAGGWIGSLYHLSPRPFLQKVRSARRPVMSHDRSGLVVFIYIVPHGFQAVSDRS